MITEPLCSQDQKERPKVGLVLSGGGAKGFSHVGVLKVLEEYNIPIDFVGGTSIGSIIGGLYSVGYDSEQMEEMILSQDWEALFSNDPIRNYVPFYEKEEQDRYLISREINEGLLKIPNYVLTNNGVIQLFSDLTLGYHDVDDFNKLPTPYFCVAVDFETGKEVLLNSGYLPEAMAASMAIPGVFPNVEIDGKVLVDGGVRNNFPVDYMRELGADIIIGIDVGAGMKTGEDLEKFGSIVDQLTTMLGEKKFKINRKDCDIYIKPQISEFTSADFSSPAAVTLIARGEEKGEEFRPVFEELAKKFESYDVKKNVGYDKDDSLNSVKITNFNVSGSRLEDNSVLGIMGIDQETDVNCTVGNIREGIDRLNASLRYSSVQYKLNKDDNNDYTLSLDLKESSKNTINFGTHYNTQDDVSLLFNGTFNNLLLRNSRISVDLKLSDVPAININYNINRGSLPGLGVSYGYRSRTMKYYVDGSEDGHADVVKNFLEANTNSVISRYFTVGLGVRYEAFKLDDIIGDFPLTADNYEFLLYRFFFKADTKDKCYYPTRGVKCYSYTDVITDNGYDLNGVIPSIVTYFTMNKTIMLNDFWAITPATYLQLQYITESETPLFYNTYIGGFNQPNDIVSQIPFWGLRWGEYYANNALSLSFENRFRIGDKHYCYFNINAFANAESLNNVQPSNLDYKFGAAIGYSFDSLVGPLEIYFSMSNDIKLRTFINIGYYF